MMSIKKKIKGKSRLEYKQELDLYLKNSPRIRAQMGFEIDHPQGFQYGTWLYYDFWPEEWKDRLLMFYLAFAQGITLPLANPLPLADPSIMQDPSRLGYRNDKIARDVYFVQIAHALWLEVSGKVPWKLEEWSDNELSYLLSSKVYFSAYRSFPSNELYYIIYVGSSSDATENILQDPRVPFRFMEKEPEQGKCMIGQTPSETCQYLSGWFHDYLHHNPVPGDFKVHDFHQTNPLLEDRFKRHSVGAFKKIYVTSLGCWSASSLFADLMRSVNIPVRKIKNILISFSGMEEHHSGLAFDWQGGSGKGRYLLHTDDLYTTSYFMDPAPAPKGTDRGVALWDHVWLDPSKFGQAFSYENNFDFFGKATFEQRQKYNDMGDWLVSSSNAILAACSMGREDTISFLQRERGFNETEADACWQAVEASVLAYGDGNMELGYRNLLDGPKSRHSQWCKRTGKCRS